MTFRDKLRRGDPLIGTLLSIGSPAAAEILSRTGVDWFFLDLEHSAMGPGEAQELLRAIGDRRPTLIRVETRDEAGIRKALDLGAAGIIVPQVNSRLEAERIVALAKFPPVGSRSVGMGRAANYGNGLSDYVASANDETVVVVQIEHVEALDELDGIASVPGVDALFVGPYDLSGSIGQPGVVDSPDVVNAIALVRRVARAHGIASGIFAGSGAVAARYLEQGFSLLAVATDGMLLGRAAEAELSGLRSAR